MDRDGEGFERIGLTTGIAEIYAFFAEEIARY